jgi:hypothetical protein
MHDGKVSQSLSASGQVSQLPGDALRPLQEAFQLLGPKTPRGNGAVSPNSKICGTSRLLCPLTEIAAPQKVSASSTISCNNWSLEIRPLPSAFLRSKESTRRQSLIARVLAPGARFKPFAFPANRFQRGSQFPEPVNHRRPEGPGENSRGRALFASPRSRGRRKEPRRGEGDLPSPLRRSLAGSEPGIPRAASAASGLTVRKKTYRLQPYWFSVGSRIDPGWRGAGGSQMRCRVPQLVLICLCPLTTQTAQSLISAAFGRA